MEEPYFLPERSKDLRNESLFWHHQHLPGFPKISFDMQIPIDLEVYGIMLLHAAVNPSVKKTLLNINKPFRRDGAYKPDSESINAYLAVGSPAVDAYRIMVKQDRVSTVGVALLPNKDEDFLPEDSTTAQTSNRRWITALRLYCAIDGHFSNIANGKWKGIVTHYKMKVNQSMKHDSSKEYRLTVHVFIVAAFHRT